MYACDFRIYFTPLPGFFSPFPHGTGSLSVERSYLALESGLPRFPPDFTCPMVLRNLSRKSVPFRVQGCHLLWPTVPSRSTRRPIFDFPTLRSNKSYNPNRVCTRLVWAIPRSLATTRGISFDFCSSCYLDVSVHRVSSLRPIYSDGGDPCGPGFPIRTSSDQCSFTSSPKLFAGCHVLHRL